jgi:hypothetical protein
MHEERVHGGCFLALSYFFFQQFILKTRIIDRLLFAQDRSRVSSCIGLLLRLSDSDDSPSAIAIADSSIVIAERKFRFRVACTFPRDDDTMTMQKKIKRELVSGIIVGGHALICEFHKSMSRILALSPDIYVSRWLGIF